MHEIDVAFVHVDIGSCRVGIRDDLRKQGSVGGMVVLLMILVTLRRGWLRYWLLMILVNLWRDWLRNWLLAILVAVKGGWLKYWLLVIMVVLWRGRLRYWLLAILVVDQRV